MEARVDVVVRFHGQHCEEPLVQTEIWQVLYEHGVKDTALGCLEPYNLC